MITNLLSGVWLCLRSQRILRARRATGSKASIAVSGIAGPHGGTAEKPVGLVHFAWSLRGLDWSHSVHFEGDREAVRRRSVAHAIRTLHDALTA